VFRLTTVELADRFANVLMRHAPTRARGKTGQPVIADNLSKAGWSWGCVSAIDANGRTIWIADAHCGDGQRFIVRADEKLTAFVELESAIRDGQRLAPAIG
jgi:hypothetical protein